MSDGKMTYEDWLRGCVHHDGRHGYVTLPCDEVLKIADFIERLRSDRKTENSSEKPNNYCDDCLYTDTCDGKEFFYACTSKATISKMEQVDKDINVRSKDEPTTQMKTQNSNLTFEKDECAKEYEELGLKELKELIKADRKDEPQTCDNCKLKGSTKWCNNQVVCRAYKPKDEPQTDCAWK